MSLEGKHNEDIIVVRYDVEYVPVVPDKCADSHSFKSSEVDIDITPLSITHLVEPEDDDEDEDAREPSVVTGWEYWRYAETSSRYQFIGKLEETGEPQFLDYGPEYDVTDEDEEVTPYPEPTIVTGWEFWQHIKSGNTRYEYIGKAEETGEPEFLDYGTHEITYMNNTMFHVDLAGEEQDNEIIDGDGDDDEDDDDNEEGNNDDDDDDGDYNDDDNDEGNDEGDDQDEQDDDDDENDDEED